MPSLSDYTPLESLLFFQSLTTLGVKASSFNTISDTLNANRFVRQHDSYDISRLTPKALEDFYNDLLREEMASQPGGDAAQNGHVNPKKRKLSTPPRTSPTNVSKQRAISEVVNRLYARYKELAIEEIRKQERIYDELRQEVQKLQDEADDAQQVSINGRPDANVSSPDRSLDIPGQSDAAAPINREATSHEPPTAPPSTSPNESQALEAATMKGVEPQGAKTAVEHRSGFHSTSPDFKP